MQAAGLQRERPDRRCEHARRPIVPKLDGSGNTAQEEPQVIQ